MSVHAGKLIREARERAGISQAELARRVTAHPQNVAKWEAAEVQTTTTLARLAAGLGLELRLTERPRPPGSFGSVLRTERKRAAWTRGELARALGVTPEVVEAWELDVERPDDRQVKAIAAALGARWPMLRAWGDAENAAAADTDPAPAPEPEPFVCDCGAPATELEALEDHYRCRRCGAEWGSS